MPLADRLLPLCLVLTLSGLLSGYSGAPAASGGFYAADDPHIRYTGRVDFSDPKEPHFWASGVYVQVRFEGASCQVFLRDEVLYGKSHNYIEIQVDEETPYKLQTRGKSDTLTIEARLKGASHVLTICKNTESGIGYLGIAGFRCRKLLDLPPAPTRKIECIGNSITCGAGSDLSVKPCGQGEWYDQHNAFLSYGPLTAKALDAQWCLSSVSGIGLIHSCCKMDITMPQVFDKVNMRSDTLAWDFSRYQPDVVTVCLGQNDGIQDSATFCGAYVQFLHKLRGYYPAAALVCLTSPMGDAKLTAVLKRYIGGVSAEMQKEGDKKIYTYFFKQWYHHGCGGHPDLVEHKEIAAELTAFLKETMKW
jgi:hypothetical protein